MKKMIILAPILLLPFIMTVPATAKDHPEKGRHYKETAQTPNADRDRNDSRGYYDRDRVYDYRNPKERPRGYSREAHGHHLGHYYVHNHHEYHYEGHWNSWDNWERYKRSHPDRLRHGGYYHEGGSLFFRYCDSGGGPCFYFSIGR